MQDPNQTISSDDYAAVIAREFEVLLDADNRRGRLIGLKVDPIDGESFIVPIEFKAAKSIAMSILKTLLFAAPELFSEESSHLFA